MKESAIVNFCVRETLSLWRGFCVSDKAVPLRPARPDILRNS
jgi:hypothetical protein